MLKKTTINDKNNIKVIAKLHQGHFKVKKEKNCENINFLSISTRLVVQLNITKADFETLLFIHIFDTHCQDIEGSVNPRRVVTPLFPLLHSFLNV